MQSKDMAPRFGKKGKVNADEVRWILSLCFVASSLFVA